ncbi:MAG: DUF72 domain-containing protein [Verrucomicrobiota bacterium]
MAASTHAWPYYLGGPVWSCKDWIGTVFHEGADPKSLLREYAKIFNTVEGNTVFYALPPMATVEKWMAESGQGFRFAMKFPKAISHERRLANAGEETRAFFRVLEALKHGDRLGPSFLQLPPSFNSNHFDILENYLKSLPQDFEYAVEARHISFYDESDNEKRLDDLLSNHNINKVAFDSRPLFSAQAEEADSKETNAQSRKPQTPVRKTVTGQRPFLRYVGRNDIEKNETYIKEWAPVINKWILEGKKPYIFVHAANEAQAPYVARALHNQLRKINPLLPEITDFASDKTAPSSEQQQLDLF